MKTPLPIVAGFLLGLCATALGAPKAHCPHKTGFARHACRLKIAVAEEAGCKVDEIGFAWAKQKLREKQIRQAIPLLISAMALNDDNWAECSPQTAAGEALKVFGPRVIPAYVAAMQPGNSVKLRRGAAFIFSISGLAKHAKRYLPQLVTAWNAKDKLLAASIQSCLEQIGIEALQPLAQLSHSGDSRDSRDRITRTSAKKLRKLLGESLIPHVLAKEKNVVEAEVEKLTPDCSGIGAVRGTLRITQVLRGDLAVGARVYLHQSLHHTEKRGTRLIASVKPQKKKPRVEMCVPLPATVGEIKDTVQ